MHPPNMVLSLTRQLHSSQETWLHGQCDRCGWRFCAPTALLFYETYKTARCSATTRTFRPLVRPLHVIQGHWRQRPRVTIIDYTNWLGERGLRTIRPERVWYGSTRWHPTHQWLLDAWDHEKHELRTFALKDVHDWADEA